MAGALTSLQAFIDKSCPATSTDKRCREAHIKLGHAHERLGSPAGAWAAYDAALAFPPHTRDAAVKADLDRVQAQLAERRDRGGDQAPVVILYRDEVGDEFNARSLSVSVDFEQVVNKEKDASDLHGADYRRIWGGSAPVGDHVVLVEAVHDCKPGFGGTCARSRLRKAWSFKSAVHAPVTIRDPRLRRGRRPRAPGPRVRPAVARPSSLAEEGQEKGRLEEHLVFVEEAVAVEVPVDHGGVPLGVRERPVAVDI